MPRRRLDDNIEIVTDGARAATDVEDKDEKERMHLVYQDSLRTVHRNAAYEETLHQEDLTKPLMITFFISCWALIIFIGFYEGILSALKYAVMIAVISTFYLYPQASQAGSFLD
jgi:hypothetical protein